MLHLTFCLYLFVQATCAWLFLGAQPGAAAQNAVCQHLHTYFTAEKLTIGTNPYVYFTRFSDLFCCFVPCR